MSNYTLDIISHYPKFENKSLKKYYVDGIETVGAYGDEPFTIQFKNNTWQKVQVIISIDGTNVLSGEKASTNSESKMWVVNPYSKMELSAWCETDFGGAAFVFTSANNSVAINTHGDLSSRGIIAAAVYVEGHVEPIKIQHHHYWNNRSRIGDYSPVVGGYASDKIGCYFNNSISDVVSTSSTISTNILRSDDFKCMSDGDGGGANFDSCEVSDAVHRGESATHGDLKSLVSVGAGQHVDQKITYVQGLIKPLLTETVRVRYLWWNELQSKLHSINAPAPHPTGFPGDHGRKNIDLKGTPRIGSFSKAFPRQEAPIYTRV